MTPILLTRIHAVLLTLIAFVILGTQVAQAHGEFGEHINEFEKHLDDYQQDVTTLISMSDGIVADYAAGKDAAAAVDALAEKWEDVGYHLVVETKATPLYPSIWQGVAGLRAAVSSDAALAEVRAARDRLAAALWEGMGGVRLAAARPELATGGAAPQLAEGPQATVHQIEEDLDHAVAEYAEGEVAEAKELVFQTYLNRFEGLEGDLIEQDPKLVTGLEEDFNARLPLLMERGAEIGEVQAQVDAMKESLERAEQLLIEAQTAKSEVF